MINSIYEKIIEPPNIRANFKSEIEFISWLETGTVEDLKCTLKAFEDSELYEDCLIIKNTLVKMQDTNYDARNSKTH